MHTDIKKLKAYTKSRESEIRGLHEDDDRTFWEREKFRFNGFYLRIRFLGSGRLDYFVMIETDSYILCEIVRSDNPRLFRDMRIFWIQKTSTIERLWGLFEFSYFDIFSRLLNSLKNRFIRIGKKHSKWRFSIVEEINGLVRIGEILIDNIRAGLF